MLSTWPQFIHKRCVKSEGLSREGSLTGVAYAEQQIAPLCKFYRTITSKITVLCTVNLYFKQVTQPVTPINSIKYLNQHYKYVTQPVTPKTVLHTEISNLSM